MSYKFNPFTGKFDIVNDTHLESAITFDPVSGHTHNGTDSRYTDINTFDINIDGSSTVNNTSLSNLHDVKLNVVGLNAGSDILILDCDSISRNSKVYICNVGSNSFTLTVDTDSYLNSTQDGSITINATEWVEGKVWFDDDVYSQSRFLITSASNKAYIGMQYPAEKIVDSSYVPILDITSGHDHDGANSKWIPDQHLKYIGEDYIIGHWTNTDDEGIALKAQSTGSEPYTVYLDGSGFGNSRNFFLVNGSGDVLTLSGLLFSGLGEGDSDYTINGSDSIQIPNGIWIHVVAVWGDFIVVNSTDAGLIYNPIRIGRVITEADFGTMATTGDVATVGQTIFGGNWYLEPDPGFHPSNAFDGDSGTWGTLLANPGVAYIGQNLGTPMVVTQFNVNDSGSSYSIVAEIQFSDDGLAWTGTGVFVTGTNSYLTGETNPHQYWRIVDTASVTYMQVNTLEMISNSGTVNRGFDWEHPYILGANNEDIINIEGAVNVFIDATVANIDPTFRKNVTIKNSSSTPIIYVKGTFPYSTSMTAWNNESGYIIQDSLNVQGKLEWIGNNLALIGTYDQEQYINWTGSYTDSEGIHSRYTLDNTQYGNLHAPGSDDQDLSGYAPLASPTFTGIVTLPDGSAAAPSLIFTSDADSGFYYNAKGFGYSVDGVSKLSMDVKGTILNGATWTAALTDDYYNLKLGSNTTNYSIIGMNSPGGGILDFYASGTRVGYYQIDATSNYLTHKKHIIQPNTANILTSGDYPFVTIKPTYNQTSGTAANTDLLINRTQTAVGSGTQLLIDAQVGGDTKFNVSNTGACYLKTSLTLGASSPVISTTSINATTSYNIFSGVSAGNGLTFGPGGWRTNTSGDNIANTIATYLNQASGTAGNTTLRVYRLLYNATTYGSGTQLLFEAGNTVATGGVGGTFVPVFSLDHVGKIISTVALSAATGNEIAYQLNYTTNKATSGNDTGLLISMTDTASPGASLPLDIQKVGTGSVFSVNSGGNVTLPSYAMRSGAYAVDHSTVQWTSSGPTNFEFYNLVTGGYFTFLAGKGTASYGFIFDSYSANTLTSGTQAFMSVTPEYNQASGTASNTDLLINRTQTAVGSGTQLLIDAQVSGSSKFKVDNTGNIVIPKTSGIGIKVDTTTPTFGWRDLLGSINTRPTAGSGAGAVPDYVVYRGNIYAYRFGTAAPNAHEHEAFIEFHLPHDYVPGSDIYIHAHWSQIVVDTGGGATPGVCEWEFDITYADGYGTAGGTADPFVAPKTITVTQQGSTTQYGHMIAEVIISGATDTATTFDRTKFKVDGLFLVRIHRDPTHTNDTLDQEVFLHFVDMHYQTNGVLGTKDKNTPFYT